MMFKKCKRAAFVLFCMLLFLQSDTIVHAKESQSLPMGEILIIYSDGASDEDMENVMSIVEDLTYQRFQVTYAPASMCLGQLDQFNFILCYKIERYPDGLIQEIKQREEEGNTILNARKDIKNSSGENDIRILFVGNQFLRTYLNETGLKNSYIDSALKTGKITYQFSELVQKASLVKEDDFLFLAGDLDYKSGTLEVEGMDGYFCASIGSVYHIPVTDLQNYLVRSAFIKEVAKWKWPYSGDPHAYAQYIVLDRVYPFQDTEKLLRIVTYLVNKKEPFVISVMPIYNNGSYPTMQRFCEVLRYAQANGGTIILHSPINQMPNFDVDLLNDYITTAVEIYMDQGVYPMGIQVPHNWMFNTDTIDVMSHFSTVLVSAEDDSLIQSTQDTYTNLVYKDGHQWIAPAITLDDDGISYLKTNSFAVKFNIIDDLDTIKEKINACITSFVPLKNLWDIEHSFWTLEDVMSYQNQIILINGKRVENSFVPTVYDDNYNYNRNRLQRYSKDLSQVNKKLLVAVITISLVFVWFILAARHRNKQTFFIKKSKKGKTDEFTDKE
ncbi:MAG: DUF2334 domain-containing protein [Lachnotalea sp.]